MPAWWAFPALTLPRFILPSLENPPLQPPSGAGGSEGRRRYACRFQPTISPPAAPNRHCASLPARRGCPTEMIVTPGSFFGRLCRSPGRDDRVWRQSARPSPWISINGFAVLEINRAQHTLNEVARGHDCKPESNIRANKCVASDGISKLRSWLSDMEVIRHDEQCESNWKPWC